MPLGLWRQALVEIPKYQFDKNGTKRPAREGGQLGIGDRGDRVCAGRAVLGKPNALPWVSLLKDWTNNGVTFAKGANRAEREQVQGPELLPKSCTAPEESLLLGLCAWHKQSPPGAREALAVQGHKAKLQEKGAVPRARGWQSRDFCPKTTTGLCWEPFGINPLPGWHMAVTPSRGHGAHPAVATCPTWKILELGSPNGCQGGRFPFIHCLYGTKCCRSTRALRQERQR